MLKASLSMIGKGLKNLWDDESAQGATEYILLLVVVVGIAMMFRTRISKMVSNALGNLEGGMNSFTPESVGGQ